VARHSRAEVSLLSLIALGLATAHAAEVTDMAPGAGVLFGASYGGSALRGDLVEQGEVISGRRRVQHDLDIAAELAPVDGFAITLALATTPSLVYRYPEAREMIVEPANGEGSYLAGETFADDPVIKASGLQGVWIGAAAAPFAERYAAGSSGSTWRLDVAFRPGSKSSNLFTAPKGKRGVAPGGSALRFGGAFSSDLGLGNPYLAFAYQRESAVELDVVTEDGTEWAKGLALKPASTLRTRGGVEITAYELPDEGTRFAFDLYVGGGYRSWEDVASGVYLPSVLGSSRRIPVTVGDHMTGLAGLGIDYHVNDNVRGRTGLEFRYHTPFRVEHPYDVRTSGNTWEIGWSFTVQGLASFLATDD
jgi:hypothetical protein